MNYILFLLTLVTSVQNAGVKEGECVGENYFEINTKDSPRR